MVFISCHEATASAAIFGLPPSPRFLGAVHISVLDNQMRFLNVHLGSYSILLFVADQYFG
jgi:hypothetical protein